MVKRRPYSSEKLDTTPHSILHLNNPPKCITKIKKSHPPDIGPAVHSIRHSLFETPSNGLTNGVTSENHAALETCKIHSNLGRERHSNHHCNKENKETDSTTENDGSPYLPETKKVLMFISLTASGPDASKKVVTFMGTGGATRSKENPIVSDKDIPATFARITQPKI